MNGNGKPHWGKDLYGRKIHYFTRTANGRTYVSACGKIYMKKTAPSKATDPKEMHQACNICLLKITSQADALTHQKTTPDQETRN